jgi:hypothetical protein
MRNQGLSWRKIGAHYGVSGQRVFQVFGHDPDIADAGTPTSVRAEHVAAQSAAVTQWLNEYGPVTREELFSQFPDVSPTTLRRLDYPRNLVIQTKSRPQGAGQQWSDSDITDALRRAANEMGEPLSANKYQKWYGEQPKGSVPSLPGVHLRFGSWNAATVVAGIQHGKTNRTYSRGWDSDTVLSWVAAFVEDRVASGDTVTYMDYEAWQRRFPGAPCGTTVRKITGLSWVNSMRASAAHDPRPLP